MGVQMFVCLSVCLLVCSGLIEIQTPARILKNFAHVSPPVQGGFGAVLTSASHPPGPGGPETLKAEGHIFENRLKNKRYSAGCKLTRAMPDFSAS